MKLPLKTLFITLMLTFLIGIKVNAATYDANNLRIKSNMSVNEIYNSLEGCTYKYADVAQAFKDAEDKYNVNACFLISLTKHESGYGRNALSKKYNISSFKNTNGTWKEFNSYMDCIDFTARCIDKYYLTPGSIYYKGPGINQVRKSYCPDGSKWDQSINSIIYRDFKINI